MRRSTTLFVAFACLACGVSADEAPAAKRWYRGNTHTHTLWSDGNDFPEMVALWYRDHGYHFLVLSDHNILSVHDRWLKVADVERRSGGPAIPRAVERLGGERVEIRGEGGEREVRLWTLPEIKAYVETPGFIMIQGEEVSDIGVRMEGERIVDRKPIHTNVFNTVERVLPARGKTIREAMRNAILAAREQSEKHARPILPHLNHPNYGYAVTGEDLAHVVEEEFYEVYNGAPIIAHLGDETHPSDERLWDIANTIRVAELHAPPLYAVATDDSHHYFGLPGQTHAPGRGWIMVLADALEPGALIRAMRAGDLYASSGVTLEGIAYDGKTCTIKVDAEPGVRYRIDFIGTLEGYDNTVEPRNDPKTGTPITGVYSADVGRVLQSTVGRSATYRLTGKELYVRATITASRPHPNPSFKDQHEQAWTQPVGWEKRIDAEVTRRHFQRE